MKYWREKGQTHGKDKETLPPVCPLSLLLGCKQEDVLIDAVRVSVFLSFLWQVRFQEEHMRRRRGTMSGSWYYSFFNPSSTPPPPFLLILLTLCSSSDFPFPAVWRATSDHISQERYREQGSTSLSIQGQIYLSHLVPTNLITFIATWL